MRTYTTMQIAQAVELHPNTVRKYEEWQLLPPPKRQANGYRVYTEYHLTLIRLIRIGYSVEIIHGNLRRKITEVIQKLAKYDFTEAEKKLAEYLVLLSNEKIKAQEAINLISDNLQEQTQEKQVTFSRKQAADYLEITIDTLRNWELNGLVEISRQKNGYRSYNASVMKQLKIIRTLRNANYSLSGILRLMQAIKDNGEMNSQEITQTLNQLSEQEYIHSVCDTLLISLDQAQCNSEVIKDLMGKLAVLKAENENSSKRTQAAH